MTTPDPSGTPELRAVLAQFASRLDKIDARLAALESPAKPLEPKPHVDHTAAAPAQPYEMATPAPTPTPAPAPTPKINIAAPSPQQQIHTPPPVVAPQPSRAAAFVAAANPAPTPTPAAAPQPLKPTSLESVIGKSWTSWIGGFILLIGILFFIKYAYDQGWFHPSPTVRVILGLAAGLVLLLFGQWTHAKKMPALAASLSATGLTVLIATFFAAHSAFTSPLIDQPTAFFAVLATGILGIFLSLYMRQITLTLLAQIGMYISPLILRSDEDKSLSFLVYLAAVTLMSLGVSLFKPRWIAVRIIALIAAWQWLFIWSIFTPLPDHFLLANIAISLCFVFFLAESLATLHRTPTRLDPKPSTALEILLAAFSFASTASAFITSAIIYYRTGNTDMWALALGFAGLMALAAFLTPSSAFSTAALIQAIALVVLAVPLYFHHYAVTATWAVFALALATFAGLRNNRLTRIWSLILLFLVALAINVDTDVPGFLSPLFFIADQPFSLCFLFTIAAALLSLLCGYLNRPRLLPKDDGTFTKSGVNWYLLTCLIFASFLWFITGSLALHPDSPLTLHLILWAALLFGFERLLPPVARRSIDYTAVAFLAIAGIKWFVWDAFLPMTSGGGSDFPILSIPLPQTLFFLNAFLLTAAYFCSSTMNAVPTTRAWLTTATLFALINIAVLRAIDAGLAAPIAPLASNWIIKNVALSILWGLTGAGFIVTGFKLRASSIRWTGLILLGITVAKVLLIDMADVQTILRVASFMLLGILLLAVSYLYHRIAQKPAQSN